MKSVVRIYNIVVECYADSVSSSVVLANSSLREDFKKFAEGIRHVLESNGYSIDNFEASPNNDSTSVSYYVVYHRSSDETPTTIKCIFKVRLSNHGLGNDKEQPWVAEKRQKKHFINTEVPEFEKQLNKDTSDSRYRNVVVHVGSNSTDSYKDFNEALSKESVKLLNWSSRF